MPAGLGFFKGALFALCVTSIVGGVLLGGAIADRRWCLELLTTHARALRGAEITLNVAAPGMGRRSRIDVRPDGILLRNINVQDLVALAYGVNHYAVWKPDDVRRRPRTRNPGWSIRTTTCASARGSRRRRTSTHTRCVRESRSFSPIVSGSKSTSMASASRPAAPTTFPCPRSSHDGSCPASRRAGAHPVPAVACTPAGPRPRPARRRREPGCNKCWPP